MSRTDKDTPYWVLVRQPGFGRQAHHRHHLLGTDQWGYRGGQWRYADECDIESFAAPHIYGAHHSIRHVACDYGLPRYIYDYFDAPSRIDRRLNWHKPDRAMSRRALREIARSYDGDTDVLDDSRVRLDQHRGSMNPGGGWWN